MLNNIYITLSKLDDCIIAHKEYLVAMNGILRCWEETIFSKNKSFNCILIAEGGLGKTTICNKILEKFEEKLLNYEGYSIRTKPAFYIQIPAKTNIDNLTKIMLQKLGDINPSTGTAFDRYIRLAQKLKTSKTELIIFDEFHHVYSTYSSHNKTSVSNENIANWIKTLGDANKICICLVSLPEYVDLFLRDSQQGRRYKDQFRLYPLVINNEPERTHLKPFIIQVQEFIRREMHIDTENLAQDEFILMLFIATAGYHDFLMSLIKRALFFQLSSSNTTLTKLHFEKAWDCNITNTVRLSEINPFRMSHKELLEFYKSVRQF